MRLFIYLPNLCARVSFQLSVRVSCVLLSSVVHAVSPRADEPREQNANKSNLLM